MHKDMTAKKELTYILLSTDLLSQMLTMLTTYEWVLSDLDVALGVFGMS